MLPGGPTPPVTSVSNGSGVISEDGELSGLTDIDESRTGEDGMGSAKLTPCDEAVKTDQIVFSGDQESEQDVKNAPNLPKSNSKAKSTHPFKSPPLDCRPTHKQYDQGRGRAIVSLPNGSMAWGDINPEEWRIKPDDIPKVKGASFVDYISGDESYRPKPRDSTQAVPHIHSQDGSTKREHRTDMRQRRQKDIGCTRQYAAETSIGSRSPKKKRRGCKKGREKD